jgi:WD repeat-containing protein 44
VADLQSRKGASFLSRLNMRTPWNKDDDEEHDSDSELGELRDDGTHARALTSVAGAGGGYIPFYKEPPRYIRVKPRNKKERDFNRLFLAQELSGRKLTDETSTHGRAPATVVGSKILRGGDAIWAAEFSVDGKYLAVAGKDQIVRVFAVISTPEERTAHEEEEAHNGNDGEKLSAPVFRSKPIREFEGHAGEVLALSWSKNNFLLSSSMDKTVRLWYPQRPDCLCTFKHSDLVTSIAFHPTDDRFFLAGSLDAQLRLWNIPDKSVAFTTTTNEFITAVGFTPDGKTAICGTLSGMCTFYETDGLKSQFQIHVRSSRGKNAKGSKITGIRTASVRDAPDKDDVKVLISSNDSRVRIYSLKTRVLEAKFRGLENQSSQIHARFSDDGRYVISGSEDRKAYIWGPHSAEVDKDKHPYECFGAHPEVVTVAVMAPTKSRQLLSASGDPIYDLCNPPPVKLVSLDERGTLPESTNASSDGDNSPRDRQDSSAKKPDESPAYLERCKHCDGNIIVTADRTGTIKVFRQDCAFVKRQQNIWETSSKFSGKLTNVGRSASIRTKASAGSRINSRRGSLSLASGHFAGTPTQASSDRIASWRQDIDGGLRASRNATPTRSERSVSPSKAGMSLGNHSTSTSNLAADARRQAQTHRATASTTSSVPGSPVSLTSNAAKLHRGSAADERQKPTVPPTPSFSIKRMADNKEERSEGSFWNLNRWRATPAKSNSSLTPDEDLSTSTGRNFLGISTDPKKGEGKRAGSRLRLSMDPAILSEMSSRDTDDKPATPSRPSAGTKRVDSGVGRLSAESAE